jgi:hypothetical protein
MNNEFTLMHGMESTKFTCKKKTQYLYVNFLLLKIKAIIQVNRKLLDKILYTSTITRCF